MKRQTCKIWRASLNGECKQIAESEAALWHELENNNFWFCENGEGIALVEWDKIEPVSPHRGITTNVYPD
jgi:hypothetical protein